MGFEPTTLCSDLNHKDTIQHNTKHERELKCLFSRQTDVCGLLYLHHSSTSDGLVAVSVRLIGEVGDEYHRIPGCCQHLCCILCLQFPVQLVSAGPRRMEGGGVGVRCVFCDDGLTHHFQSGHRKSPPECPTRSPSLLDQVPPHL